MTDEKSHVDWAVERIEKQIHVYILTQLAAQDPAPECGVGFLAAWHHEAFAESCDDISVALAGGKNGGNNASTAAAKNFDELTHLLAHVGADRAGIGEVEFAL